MKKVRFVSKLLTTANRAASTATGTGAVTHFIAQNTPMTPYSPPESWIGYDVSGKSPVQLSKTALPAIT